MDIRTIQKPIKAKYREDASSALITLKASAATGDTPIVCSVDSGRAIQEAYAHAGVGGGGGACSGDLLLGALAACAQITCQMVAAAMNIAVSDIRVSAEGDLDLRGTLGIADVPVGFSDIRLRIKVEAPSATPEELRSLFDKTERYCVVLQTLVRPPNISAELV